MGRGALAAEALKLRRWPFDAIVESFEGSRSEEPIRARQPKRWRCGKQCGSRTGISQGAAMTRKELLRQLLLQARGNGFEFRKWYQTKIDRQWASPEEAIATLASGNRYFALLFSHEFAQAFWKKGAQMQFVVPTQKFQRKNARGETVTVTRKAYTRRTVKADAWEYHLREMAAAEEPLRYIRRFLATNEELRAQRAGIDRLDADTPDDPSAQPKSRP